MPIQQSTSVQLRPNETEPWSDNAHSPSLTMTFPFGLNENVQQHIGECSSGYNFELGYGNTSFIPRDAFDLKGTATNAQALTSLMQLVKKDNTETTLACAGDTVYQWDGTLTGFTSKATVTAPALLRDAYWSLNDVIIITDVELNNNVAVWDGTTYSTLTTGLADTLKAKYAVIRNNRVWFFNIKSGATSYPHMILASVFENYQSYDISKRGGPTTVGGGSFTTGLEAFYLLMPDGKPINGVSLFQDVLVVSTDNGRMWQISGDQSANYEVIPFYDTQPAIAEEAVAAIGNDVVFLRQGGSIALLYAVQAFGNVVTSTLSWWIPQTTANLSTVNAIVYDVLNQKVFIFIPGKVLVLFKALLSPDRQTSGHPSPWSVYTTTHTSNFNTQAAKYMLRPGTTDYSVFWGDASGNIFDMNGDGPQDAGTDDITTLRRSRHIGTEILRPWPWVQENLTGNIRYRRINQIDFAISIDWDDEYQESTTVVVLKGGLTQDDAAYFGGLFYYGDSKYYNQGVSAWKHVGSVNIEPGGKGPGFYMTVSATTGFTFQVDSLELD